jgi:Fe-S-cluster containining protein
LEKRWVATIDLETLEVEYDPTFKFKCLEDCGKCCYELEIPVRDEDIARIEELGYSAWEFVDYNKMFYRGDKFLGYAIKKNPVTDECVFLDPETKKCKIYRDRPLACRLYPFVFVKHGETMEIYIRMDFFCPGVNHPEGEEITAEFILREYGDILRDYQDKLIEDE